jgi:hypothetical protein
MHKNDGDAGQAVADVLPQHGKPWYRVSHLLKLNMLLLIPLMSSAIAGFDGMLHRLREWLIGCFG